MGFGIWNFSFVGHPRRVLYRTLWLLYCILALGCNGNDVPDCFQNSGDLVREEVVLPSFSKLTVFEGVSVVIKQGEGQKVEIETGEFLRNEITAVVEGDRLVLRNENGCNFFREYGLTRIFVTSPNITEIRSSTGFPIESAGVLAFPNLSLFSESFTEPDAGTTDGEFDLEVASQRVSVVVNGIAYFKLGGNVDLLTLTVAAGDSRIEAEELMAQDVNLNHRGSNDVLVNPQQSLSGTIRGTGDVISFNRPDTVEIEELFNGRLIFR